MAQDDPWYDAVYAAAAAIFQDMQPENPTTVALADLETVCDRMGVHLAAHELTQAMYDLDASGEMVVQLEAFVSWWLARLRAEEAAEAERIAAQAATAPTAHLWETVVDGDVVYYYDYTTNSTQWTLPELVTAVMTALDGQESIDRQLAALFAKHDVASRGKLDDEEWQGLLIGLGLHADAISLQELTGNNNATDVSYEDLHSWWYANAPQRRRERLADWTEWWQVQDEAKAVFFLNERTQVMQWDHPRIPSAVVAALDGSGGGVSLDDKMIRWFSKLDADSDGVLNQAEVAAMLTQLGQPPAAIPAALQALGMDYDATGLSMDAITPWWKTWEAKGRLGDWEIVASEEEESAPVYYYNWKTGETQWEPPDVAAKMETFLDQWAIPADVPMEERIRRLFVQYDTDETGALDANEVKRLCAALGRPLDPPALASLMRVLDTSGDGYVSLDEFQAWWRAKHAVEERFEEAAGIQSRTDEVRAICAAYMHQSVDVFLATPLESIHVPRLIQALGRTCRGAALLAALHDMDKDGMRTISPDVFVAWYIKYDDACREKETKAHLAKQAKGALDVWTEQMNEQGQVVYMNTRTNEVMWEKPGIQQRMQALMQGADMKAVFQQFDRDQSGTIDASELQALLQALGQPVDDKAKLHDILTIIDTSGDGVVSLDELTTWWICMQRRTIATTNAAELQSQLINYHAVSKEGIKELRKLFDHFDTDKSGSIDRHELKHLLARLGVHPTDAERHKLMKTIDTSGDGEINVDEFIAWWVASHRTKEIQAGAARDGHLLSAIQAQNTAKESDSTSLTTTALNLLSDVSLSALRNTLVDLRYNWTKGAAVDVPPDVDEPVNYGARKFGSHDVSCFPPAVVDTLQAIIDDVVLISPLFLADAAQRIQKMYRAKRARVQLLQTLNERYVHHHDAVTGASYYVNRLTREVRYTKPLLLGQHEILTPRTKLRRQHEERAMRQRRDWMVAAVKDIQTMSPLFRTAAFFVYNLLCDIQAQWRRGIWAALQQRDYVRAQLVAAHFPRQLKKPGPWGDLPLHFAIRHRLGIDVVRRFLESHPEVALLGNASGHTPLHLACRDDASVQVVQALLRTEKGRQACCRATTDTANTPLHLAVLHGAPMAILELLVDADPTAIVVKNKRRRNAFHEAVLSPRPDALDVVKLFVKANPGAINLGTIPAGKEAAWALHLALVHGAEDAMVHYLVALAPDGVRAPFRQLLPLFLAMKHGSSEALIRVVAMETFAALPFTAIQTSKRFNPVHYALLYRLSSDLVLFFLDASPEWASQVNHRLEFPLHLAAAYSADVNLTKKLLLLDPTPARLVNSAGCLPLHLAVTHGDVDVVKKLLQVCPWSLLDTIRRTKYDALMLAAKASRRFPNEPLVDALLFPPKLAPKRAKYKHLDLSPYYVAAHSTTSTMSCFDKLHLLDTCNADDLDAMARKKFQQQFHKPTKDWPVGKILHLMALNPLDAAVQIRSLVSINEIVRTYDDAAREACLEAHDIVRTLQHTMYDFSTHARIQILGQTCLRHLFPTAFAKATYQSRIDPLYK
ncbi:unnamed protein product [Aphanomyces euteiches]|uniref:Uncharacterized protein n=1 Tax=Aphanomyces euteiches TaxID=100861 RepID=A0A6G0XD89_9STRA|nr:hypothetical protein Ae201684_006150 [Aphanomyces euteiches]KAH9069147.1 hypothetical protein Ae201684P_004838 [Aphanomyces euteiches]